MTSTFSLNGRNVESYAAATGTDYNAHTKIVNSLKQLLSKYASGGEVTAYADDVLSGDAQPLASAQKLVRESGAPSDILNKVAQLFESIKRLRPVKAALPEYGEARVAKSDGPGWDDKHGGTTKRAVDKAYQAFAKRKDSHGMDFRATELKNKYLELKKKWESASGYVISPTWEGPPKVVKASAHSLAVDTPAQWGQRLVIRTTPNNMLLMMDMMKRLSNRPVEKDGADGVVVWSNYPKAVLKAAQAVDPKAKLESRRAEASLSLSAGKQYADLKTWIKDAVPLGRVEKQGGLVVLKDRDGRRIGEFNTATNQGEIRSKYAGQPVPTAEERAESMRKISRGEFKHPVKASNHSFAQPYVRQSDEKWNKAKHNWWIKFSDEKSAASFVNSTKSAVKLSQAVTRSIVSFFTNRSMAEKLFKQSKNFDSQSKLQVHSEAGRPYDEPSGQIIAAAADDDSESAAGNLRYVFPTEQAAAMFVSQVFKKLSLKGGYRGRAAVVLRPGPRAADVADLARASGGKPTASA